MRRQFRVPEHRDQIFQKSQNFRFFLENRLGTTYFDPVFLTLTDDFELGKSEARMIES